MFVSLSVTMRFITIIYRPIAMDDAQNRRKRTSTHEWAHEWPYEWPHEG